MGDIAVGVDGSATSKAALRWALDEAKRRACGVRAIHAWQYPYVGALPAQAMPMIDRDQLVESATGLLADTVTEVVTGADAGIDVRQVVVEGAPAHALLTAAVDADLLVVGSRGLGGFMGLLLGSVSHQLAHHTTVPLVILPAVEIAEAPAEAADTARDAAGVGTS